MDKFQGGAEFKAARKLLNYAAKNESNKCYGEAIKSQREAVHLIHYLVNNVVKSNTVKRELMQQVVTIVQRTAALENIVAQNEAMRKHTQKKENKETTNLNVQDLLTKYFESKQGQRHTEEQMKSIVNMSKICNISKPTIKFCDVYGFVCMESLGIPASLKANPVYRRSP